MKNQDAIEILSKLWKSQDVEMDEAEAIIIAIKALKREIEREVRNDSCNNGL